MGERVSAPTTGAYPQDKCVAELRGIAPLPGCLLVRFVASWGRLGALLGALCVVAGAAGVGSAYHARALGATAPRLRARPLACVSYELRSSGLLASF